MPNIFLFLMLSDDNNLVGTIPSELAQLTSLEELDLGTNILTGPIPSDLGLLPNLSILILYENTLTGPIPPELGQLSSLLALLLQNNNLTGPIPPELGNLTSLESLFLYNNMLTGPIPPELGALVNLRFLWLDSNMLQNGPDGTAVPNATCETFFDGTYFSLTLDDEFGNPTNIVSFGGGSPEPALSQCKNALFASSAGMNRGELDPSLFVIDEDVQGHTLPEEIEEDVVSMTTSVASTTMKKAKTAKSAKKAKSAKS